MHREATKILSPLATFLNGLGPCRACPGPSGDKRQRWPRPGTDTEPRLNQAGLAREEEKASEQEASTLMAHSGHVGEALAVSDSGPITQMGSKCFFADSTCAL